MVTLVFLKNSRNSRWPIRIVPKKTKTSNSCYDQPSLNWRMGQVPNERAFHKLSKIISLTSNGCRKVDFQLKIQNGVMNFDRVVWVHAGSSRLGISRFGYSTGGLAGWLACVDCWGSGAGNHVVYSKGLFEEEFAQRERVSWGLKSLRTLCHIASSY